MNYGFKNLNASYEAKKKKVATLRRQNIKKFYG
ncbi:hypothetical protein WY13_01065 [Clostridium ljungdahlii]|uniref:Uncharacterized protein n=1 Tax=Clostridium ljungdahlii TaxID=1538 RepID=A0A166RF45_9CLOT|nr:hypothetical protein WY13_01065 [Clostridium ljungdahlii]